MPAKGAGSPALAAEHERATVRGGDGQRGAVQRPGGRVLEQVQEQVLGVRHVRLARLAGGREWGRPSGGRRRWCSRRCSRCSRRSPVRDPSAPNAAVMPADRIDRLAVQLAQRPGRGLEGGEVVGAGLRERQRTAGDQQDGHGGRQGGAQQSLHGADDRRARPVAKGPDRTVRAVAAAAPAAAAPIRRATPRADAGTAPMPAPSRHRRVPGSSATSRGPVAPIDSTRSGPVRAPPRDPSGRVAPPSAPRAIASASTPIVPRRAVPVMPRAASDRPLRDGRRRVGHRGPLGASRSRSGRRADTARPAVTILGSDAPRTTSTSAVTCISNLRCKLSP